MRRATTFFLCGGAIASALACSQGGSSSAGATCESSYDAIVAASDYSSSALGGCHLDGGGTLPFVGVDLGADPTLTATAGRTFFLARDKDTIFELDSHCAAPRAQYSVSEPSYNGAANPQDVAITSTGALWIPRFNVPTLLVLDETTGARGAIDLSSRDPDGNPNMSAIRIEEISGAEKAFVALERLDDHAPPEPPFTSRLPSSMLRIDVATRTVEAEVTLAGRNPFGTIAENGGAFFLAAPGNINAADESDAGIERFDPTNFSTTYLLGESELGGSAVEVAVNGACGVAIIADPTPTVNATSLITFDADHGTAITTAKNPILSTSGFDLAALAWRGDVLMVGDRHAAAGGYPIHLFDRTGVCDLNERPNTIFVTQKPVAIRTTP